MSQTSVDFSGDPTGDELLDNLLTPMQHNFLSGHAGTSRPSYAEQGIEWLDTTTTPWVVKRFDGSDDIIIGYINATTNLFTPAGLILDKVDATTAPTINDDNADGYSVGSKWIDITNDRAYIAVDVSTGAAIWKEISGSINGPSSSVDSEIVLFSGTTGRVVKRASGTGYVKATSGVMETPVATVPLVDLANQAANSVVVNATGSSAAPTALNMAASTMLARLAAGNIVAASVADIKTLLGISTSVVTIKKQIFTASGTYTPSTGMLYAIVEVVGGGAGGGGSSSGNSYGTGGGAGGYGRSWLSAATIGASQIVTVGGGSAGANSGGNSPAGNGGTSSFGSLISVTGGTGGNTNTAASNTFTVGPSGGVSSSADVNNGGEAGDAGISFTSVNAKGGKGGNSLFGGGGKEGVGGPGSAAVAYGAGGGGGAIASGGGAGGGGIIIITEFCSQ